MKFSQSRRLLLTGAGTSLAFPFFESLLPRSVRAQPANYPLRLLFYFTPNGFDIKSWWPQGTGSTYQLGPSCQGLEPLRQKLTFIRNLDMAIAITPGNDHAHGGAAFLTCARPQRQLPLRLATSIDQAIVQKLGSQSGRFASLHFGSGGDNPGACDGFPCGYMNTISWKSATEPVPVLRHPKAAMDLIFSGTSPTESTVDAQKRLRLKKSVFDFALSDINTISNRLGSEDKVKLDAYMQGVNELERVVADTAKNPQMCAKPGVNTEVGATDYLLHVKLLTQIAALAFRCDLTRVMTFMYANVQSFRDYSSLGVNAGHHQVSHHGGNQSMLASLRKIDRHMMDSFGELLVELDKSDESGQSVLDRSLVHLGGELSDGDRHTHRDLPIIVAGSAGGKVKTGTVINMPPNTPKANLFVTLADLMGTPLGRFGNSTGPLQEILA